MSKPSSKPSGTPRYGDKHRYRTRQSGSEVDAIDDMANTGIDRPMVDLDAASAELAGPRPPAGAPPASGARPIVFIAFALIAFVGAALGAYFALR